MKNVLGYVVLLLSVLLFAGCSSSSKINEYDLAIANHSLGCKTSAYKIFKAEFYIEKQQFKSGLSSIGRLDKKMKACDELKPYFDARGKYHQ